MPFSGREAALMMSQNTLELGQIILTSSTRKLRLSVTSTASFQLPQSLATQNQTDTLKALTSGYVWTSRGVGCSLDIRILLDGQPLLDSKARSAILERLGGHVRENKVWTQLCLSSDLEVNVATSEASPDICIALKHVQNTPWKLTPRGWLLDKTDLIPPKDVLRADMDKIQVRLEFLTVNDLEQTDIRSQEEVDQDNNSRALLLDRAQAAPQSDHLTQFEETVRRIKSLPFHVAASFGHFRPILPRRPGLEHERQNLPVGMERAHSYGADAPNSGGGLIKSGRLPQASIKILQAWLKSHILQPFPTLNEKQSLMQQTGLTKRQIETWMYSKRRLVSARSSTQDDDMLFQGLDSKNTPIEDEFTDLLSQSSEDKFFPYRMSTYWGLSESSDISSNSPPIEPNMPLDLSAASNLIDGALQTLIGGHSSRIPLPPDVRVERALSENSLSQIVPTMFNPGYRELMAHHAHFLPTLTNSITNVLKTAQKPSLKKKTEQLAAMPFSPLANEDDNDLDRPSHISRVLQTSLFSMMQRTLYDPSATRKLWKKSKLNEHSDDLDKDEDASPDLLDDKSPKSYARQWDDLLAHITSDDDFEDLLYGDDEEDDEYNLLDESECERLAIERETEEMLFGDGRGGDEDGEEDEYLLSGEESDGGEMLL